MKNLIFATLVGILIGGCANLPPPAYQYSSPQSTLPDRVCWLFEGEVYCPPADGGPLVLPCKSANSVYARPVPMLPAAPRIPAPQVVGVIAPTDSRGRPTKAAEICGEYGCVGANTPAAIVQYQPYRPPIAWWVQEPAKACAKVIIWGPQLGHGPWGLPSGPPLRK